MNKFYFFHLKYIYYYLEHKIPIFTSKIKAFLNIYLITFTKSQVLDFKLPWFVINNFKDFLNQKSRIGYNIFMIALVGETISLLANNISC